MDKKDFKHVAESMEEKGKFKEIEWSKNPATDKNNELIYVSGLPTEAKLDEDICRIFDDVPIVKVLKIWSTDVFLISTLFLVHKNNVPLIWAYDKKQLFRNLPPIMVLPVNVFKEEERRQFKTLQASTSNSSHLKT